MVPKDTTAQGRSKQIQGAWVQTEGLELLCQKAEALSLAATLPLKLSNPGLKRDPLCFMRPSRAMENQPAPHSSISDFNYRCPPQSSLSTSLGRQPQIQTSVALASEYFIGPPLTTQESP